MHLRGVCLCIHPFSPHPISIGLHMIYTLCDSRTQPETAAQSMWLSEIPNRKVKYDSIYVVLPVHFSPTFSHSVKVFARFGKCAGAPLSCGAFKSPSPPHFSPFSITDYFEAL